MYWVQHRRQEFIICQDSLVGGVRRGRERRQAGGSGVKASVYFVWSKNSKVGLSPVSILN